jgi:hypothetical protein
MTVCTIKACAIIMGPIAGSLETMGRFGGGKVWRYSKVVEVVSERVAVASRNHFLSN